DGDPSATATVALTDVRVVGGRLVVESPTTSVAVLGLDADIARATLSDPAAPAPEIVARRASGEVVLAEIGRRFDVVAVNAAALLNDGTSFAAEAAMVDGARLSAVRGTYRAATGLELTLRADEVPLADLQWLIADLPDAGTASFTLDLAPLGEGRSRVALTELAAASGAPSA